MIVHNAKHKNNIFQLHNLIVVMVLLWMGPPYQKKLWPIQKLNDITNDGRSQRYCMIRHMRESLREVIKAQQTNIQKVEYSVLLNSHKMIKDSSIGQMDGQQIKIKQSGWEIGNGTFKALTVNVINHGQIIVIFVLGQYGGFLISIGIGFADIIQVYVPRFFGAAKQNFDEFFSHFYSILFYLLYSSQTYQALVFGWPFINILSSLSFIEQWVLDQEKEEHFDGKTYFCLSAIKN